MAKTRSNSTPLSFIIEAFHGICLWCARSVEVGSDPFSPLAPTREHLIHRSAGGSNARDNFALACYGCNQARQSADFPPGFEPSVSAAISTAHRMAVIIVTSSHVGERRRAAAWLKENTDIAGERIRAREAEHRNRHRPKSGHRSEAELLADLRRYCRR